MQAMRLYVEATTNQNLEGMLEAARDLGEEAEVTYMFYLLKKGEFSKHPVVQEWTKTGMALMGRHQALLKELRHPYEPPVWKVTVYYNTHSSYTGDYEFTCATSDEALEQITDRPEHGWVTVSRKGLEGFKEENERMAAVHKNMNEIRSQKHLIGETNVREE